MAIVWDGGAITCSTDESPIPQFKPLIVCRDCSCAFAMIKEQCPVDFSLLKKRGFELDICPPNDQNVTYFNFRTNKSRPQDCPPGCLPAKVCCSCPLCRPKERAGYHFRDCTCYLCMKKRDACLNRYRYELLAARKQARALKMTNSDESEIREAFSKVFRKYADEDEDFVPMNPSQRCLCHWYVPKNWCVIDPCPKRGECSSSRPEKVQELLIKPEPASVNRVCEGAVYLGPEPIKKMLTPSLSQLRWPVEAYCVSQTGADYFRLANSPSDCCVLRAGIMAKCMFGNKPKPAVCLINTDVSKEGSDTNAQALSEESLADDNKSGDSLPEMNSTQKILNPVADNKKAAAPPPQDTLKIPNSKTGKRKSS